MAELNISTQELRTTATDIRSLNVKMDEDLQECNNAVQKLSATYQSEGSEQIRADMNALKPKFEEYKNVIESYAKFLDRTAESTDTTEKTVVTNEGRFKQ